MLCGQSVCQGAFDPEPVANRRDVAEWHAGLGHSPRPGVHAHQQHAAALPAIALQVGTMSAPGVLKRVVYVAWRMPFQHGDTPAEFARDRNEPVPKRHGGTPFILSMNHQTQRFPGGHRENSIYTMADRGSVDPAAMTPMGLGVCCRAGKSERLSDDPPGIGYAPFRRHGATPMAQRMKMHERPAALRGAARLLATMPG